MGESTVMHRLGRESAHNNVLQALVPHKMDGMGRTHGQSVCTADYELNSEERGIQKVDQQQSNRDCIVWSHHSV